LTGRHPRQGSICCGDFSSQSSIGLRRPVSRQRNPAESWPCFPVSAVRHPLDAL